MDSLEELLNRLAICIRNESYESLETDWLEIKPVPSTGNAWDSIRETICAFLNTRGGVVLLGVKEEQHPARHFSFTGYTENNSGNLSALRSAFTDARRDPIEIGDCLRVEVRSFETGQVALVRVSALPEDRKFCLYRGEARERIADRDERISHPRIEEQHERKREMETFRELRPVDGVALEDLSLQRINELVLLINQGQAQQIVTIKSTLAAAVPFLETRRFMLKDSRITTLGALVCASRPEEHLLFRSQLDAFVDVPNAIAQDKKTFRDNILQLMEAGRNWTLRNIMTGISAEAGGTLEAEYPEKLIRESINNALAHRDYHFDRPVQLTLKPRHSLTIRNPGRLPHELVFEKLDDAIPVRRVFANPRARNPRLADILKLHNKWEGRGVGMSDLVNFALANQIGLPHYQFHSADEISLCIPAGKLLDESMEAWLDLLGGFIEDKAQGRALSNEEKLVLTYVIKSELANRQGLYTLALTPGNNHFGVIADLKACGLISLHPVSDRFREVYVCAREFVSDDSRGELRAIFAKDFDRLDAFNQQTLNMILLAEKYSKAGGLNAKQVTRLLKHRLPEELHNRGDDEFYRAIRYRIERLAPDKKSLDLDADRWHSVPESMLSIHGPSNRPLFRVNRSYQSGLL